MPFFLTPDNARLWYDDWHQPNPTATDVLFFLHGFTGYRNNWGYEKNGAAWLLRSRYRCIFLETRGIHASRQAKGPYTIEQQAKDVVALCDYLEVDKFTYCGHSMGGGTGFQLAATVPSRLHKMVLLAPMPSNGVPMRDPDPPQTRTHLTHHYSYPKWEDEKKAMERCVVLSEGRPSDTLSFFQDRARMVTKISQEYWIQVKECETSERGVHMSCIIQYTLGLVLILLSLHSSFLLSFVLVVLLASHNVPSLHCERWMRCHGAKYQR